MRIRIIDTNSLLLGNPQRGTRIRLGNYVYRCILVAGTWALVVR